jgi:hypothetical protein
MIDHLCLRVPQSKYEETVAFYLAALAPIGYKKIVEYPTAVALGEDKRPNFTIIATGESLGNIHFSFASKGENILYSGFKVIAHVLNRSGFD